MHQSFQLYLSLWREARLAMVLNHLFLERNPFLQDSVEDLTFSPTERKEIKRAARWMTISSGKEIQLKLN